MRALAASPLYPNKDKELRAPYGKAVVLICYPPIKSGWVAN